MVNPSLSQTTVPPISTRWGTARVPNFPMMNKRFKEAGFLVGTNRPLPEALSGRIVRKTSSMAVATKTNSSKETSKATKPKRKREIESVVLAPPPAKPVDITDIAPEAVEDVSASITQTWTDQAIKCYLTSADCANCSIPRGNYSFVCQMNKVVPVLKQTLGEPDPNRVSKLLPYLHHY